MLDMFHYTYFRWEGSSVETTCDQFFYWVDFLVLELDVKQIVSPFFPVSGFFLVFTSADLRFIGLTKDFAIKILHRYLEKLPKLTTGQSITPKGFPDYFWTFYVCR